MPLTVKGRQFCLFPQKIVILSLLLLQEGRCRRRSALQRGSDAYAPGPCGQIGAFAARRSSLGSNAADLRQFLRPRRALQHPVAATKIGHGMFRLRSEEHTSELQSLMRISYAVFCLKKKNNTQNN